ncbi:MAG: O-antigen ligase family protein [Candidatus Terrybacteria bacterium]|nr:O-antigen ligase family protein [Candidatus Terrybacteria bacterium]
MDIELTSWWQLLVVAIGVGGEVFFTFRRPSFGAAAVMLLLPAYLLRIRVAPFPTNALELLLLALAAGYMTRVFVLRERPSFTLSSPVFWSALALIATGAVLATLHALRISGIESASARTILGALKGFLGEPILFVILLSAIPSSWPRAFSTALRGYVWGAAAIAAAALGSGVAAFLAHCSGEALLCHTLTFDGRLRFLYGSPNELAMYLVPAAMLVFGIENWGLRIGGKVRWAVLALFFGALLWTQSLGALAAAAAGLIFLFAFRYRRRAAEWFAYATMAIGAIFPFAIVAFSDFLMSEGARSSFASRVMIWRSAITLVREQWLLGIGPGAFQAHYLALQERFPQYLEWAVLQPHNLFLSLWLGAGLFGLLGFLLLLIAAFRRARFQSTSPLAGAALSALVALTVVGSVDTPFWRNDISIIFLLAFALVLLPDTRALDHKERDRP